MEVKNVQIHRGLTFEQYLALPGYSHSGLKNKGQVIKPTAKMNFGTEVHNCCNDGSGDAQIRKIAATLKKAIGAELFDMLECEVAVTAEFHHEGFVMLYKGRLDLTLVGKLVVDIKIIGGKSIYDTIEMFGYNNQVTAYAVGSKA